jgi:hypothetical protein
LFVEEGLVDRSFAGARLLAYPHAASLDRFFSDDKLLRKEVQLGFVS